ncbi:MAG: motility protein A, partial [Candidatus Marinimicrobia bacterium]|nr:motility protein A [Candidatus Neomarinimicrobiota bacterium]
MDFGTIIGLFAGIAIIIFGILGSGGELIWFANGVSILIVVGGTFSATMVNLPLRAVGDLFKILKN